MKDASELRPGAAGSVEPAEILVAVPTLNEERHIAATLTGLLAGEGRQTKIVVADGGSTDATRAIVARLAAQHDNLWLIDNSERLQSAAINRVVAEMAEPATAYWYVSTPIPAIPRAMSCGWPRASWPMRPRRWRR